MARIATGAAIVVLVAALVVARRAPAPERVPEAAPWSGTPPRHVLVVLVDTLRADAIGVYAPGRPGVTPRLDAFADAHLRFDAAVSTSGWTLPAVGSLLTAQWPTVHGGLGKGDGMLVPIRPELTTVAEVLREAGFRTAAFVNAAFLSPVLGLERGFDVFDHRHAYNDSIRRADETVDAALAFLGGAGDERTFVLLHLFDPHLDYDPLPEHAGGLAGRTEPPLPLDWTGCRSLEREGAPPTPEDVAYVRAAYDAEVAAVDAEFGRLEAGLRELGLWEDSAIVVTSDHGEELWEHGGFEHGHALYDELVRIPLLLKLPGAAPTAGVIPSQVRILDVGPTVLDLVGLDAPPTFVGRSLLPLVDGRDATDRVAFLEGTLYGHERIGWRTGRYTYVLDLHPEAEIRDELYDRRTDPGETENLAARRPWVRHWLRWQLVSFYQGLRARAGRLSSPAARDLSPDAMAAYLESLESLGYVRTEDEVDQGVGGGADDREAGR